MGSAGLKRFIQVAVGVIYREGKFLIAQRRQSDSFPGYWEFPGGKLEVGESPEICLRRELWEELEIKIKVHGTLQESWFESPTVKIQLFPFICEAENEPAKLNAHQKYEWVESADVSAYQLL